MCMYLICYPCKCLSNTWQKSLFFYKSPLIPPPSQLSLLHLHHLHYHQCYVKYLYTFYVICWLMLCRIHSIIQPILIFIDKVFVQQALFSEKVLEKIKIFKFYKENCFQKEFSREKVLQIKISWSYYCSFKSQYLFQYILTSK